MEKRVDTMAVPKLKPSPAPRRRRPPALRVDEDDMVDWDYRIASPPRWPSRTVWVRFVKAGKLPFHAREEPLD
ncbi:MAG: hypothetical protein FJ291_15825 [Planctomycetes bacterium]|nr:hypothetical protein [Planctomycetota bacterium]